MIQPVALKMRKYVIFHFPSLISNDRLDCKFKLFLLFLLGGESIYCDFLVICNCWKELEI